MCAEPLRALSLGAGVQSSTLLLMSLAGDLAPFDVVVWADTGWEPAPVYRHLAWLERHALERGVAITRVSAGSLRDAVLEGATGDPSGVPLPAFLRSAHGQVGMARRQCTGDLKIDPIHAELRTRIGLGPGMRWQRGLPPGVTLAIGFSWDERHRATPSRHRWLEHWYPLLGRRMTRLDCLEWLRAHGLPEPPRSACIGCPYRSQAEWRWLRDEDPEGWQDALEVDAAIRHVPRWQGEGFLHRSAVPLADVDLSTPEDHGQLRLWDHGCSEVRVA